MFFKNAKEIITKYYIYFTRHNNKNQENKNLKIKTVHFNNSRLCIVRQELNLYEIPTPLLLQAFLRCCGKALIIKVLISKLD